MRGNGTLVALMLALLLVVLILGCGGYGVLLHAKVVEPPQVGIRIGQFTLRSTLIRSCPSLPAQLCGRPRKTSEPVYSVWLFRYAENPTGATSATLLLQLTLPPPDTIASSRTRHRRQKQWHSSPSMVAPPPAQQRPLVIEGAFFFARDALCAPSLACVLIRFGDELQVSDTQQCLAMGTIEPHKVKIRSTEQNERNIAKRAGGNDRACTHPNTIANLQRPFHGSSSRSC
jgi:hypothetical protein